MPGLGSRIEEGHNFAGVRIRCLNLSAFELVAAATGKPEIFLFRRTATGRGDDVLDGEGLPDDFGRCAAVTAMGSGLSQETNVQRSGHGV